MVATFEQRDEEARGERVSGGGPVDGVDGRRCCPRDLLPVLAEHGALGTERDRDEPVAPQQALELVPVDDGEIGVDCNRATRRGVEAEDARASLPRAHDYRVRNLELAENRVVLGNRDLADVAIGAGRDDDLRLARRVDQDRRDAGRLVGLRDLECDACAAKTGERLVGERIRADRTDHRHGRPEARARDSLICALSARVAREGRIRDRLAGPWEPLAPRDQVEVDRPDDGDPWSQAASARRSSTVEPSSVSRRSKSPAHSDERSGQASRLAAVARPSSARTRTASSR